MKIKILIGITLLNFGFTNYINAQSPKENIVINTDSTPHKNTYRHGQKLLKNTKTEK